MFLSETLLRMKKSNWNIHQINYEFLNGYSARSKHRAYSIFEKWVKNRPSTVGFEPTTFGLEVQRAIPCATRT